MQIQMLRSFLELAKSDSISECSQRLNISQQGLSRQLNAMEQELGIALFDRSHQGIKLTTAGRAAVPLFARVVTDYQAGINRLSAYRQPKATKLRIFVCPGIKQSLGLDFFYRFQEEHPQLKLDLQFAEDDRCEKALLAGDADAAFLDWPHHPAAFHRQLVVKSRLVAVMKANNPLAKSSPLSMRQLAGVQVYFPDETNYMSQRFRKHWPQFYSAMKIPFSSNDYDTFYRLPLHLGGVALTFHFLCHHLERELVAIPIKERSFVEISFCWRTGIAPVPALRLLADYLTENVHMIEKD